MRIAWFTHRYHPCIGGAETFGRAMVRRFVEAGHAVDVFTGDAHDLRYFTDRRHRRVDAPAESIVDGARVRRFAVKHLPMQRYAGRLLSYAPHWRTQCQVASYMPIIPGIGKVRGDYDAVFGVGFPYTLFSYAALRTARAANAPLILTPFLHLATPGDPVNRTYTRPHQIRLLSESDLVVSPTRLESEVVAGWGIPRSRLLTLPMAIEHHEVTGGDGLALRARYGIGSGPVVGQLGALDPNKGTPDLIRAVDRLNRDRAEPIRLLLAGSATPEFNAFFAQGGWASRPWLMLFGAIPSKDVPSFYDAIDVFAMPSRTDSFGIVYLEAWANGKPVVAAAAGGVPEVVSHGKTGLLIEFGDISALAESIAKLLDNRAYAAQLGETGRALVHDGYTWGDRCATLLDRVEQTIKARRGPLVGSDTFLHKEGGDQRRSRRLPIGLVGMLVMVLSIEAYVSKRPIHYTNTATLSWSLSDSAARGAARTADVICLGDSLVKHGMIPEVLAAKLGQRVYNLSICASSAPATYFILKHAIDAGARPKTIIVDFMPDLLTGSPRHSSRNWPEILSYAELVELARAGRDFSFFVTMARDRLVSTYRSRWEIRTNIVTAIQGKTDPLSQTNLVYQRNWTLHNGAEYTPNNLGFHGQVSEEEHYKLMSDHFWCNHVNRDYIHKLIALAESSGARVYWLLPPVSPGIHARRVRSGADDKFSDFVRQVRAKHPAMIVLDARRSGYDHTKFVDPVHLNGLGGVALSTEVAEAIRSGRTEWVWLPRYRDHVAPVRLEDVEQSRLAVGAGDSIYR